MANLIMGHGVSGVSAPGWHHRKDFHRPLTVAARKATQPGRSAFLTVFNRAVCTKYTFRWLYRYSFPQAICQSFSPTLPGTTGNELESDGTV